jgi:DNA topoisomerase-1
MEKSLVVVESPAKAKTIRKYLGPNFEVMASVGHIMDLPARSMGVDLESGNFTPEYEAINGKAKVIADLKRNAKKADKVYLAPDPDREGEAIAFHIANIVKRSPAKGYA